MWPCVFPIALLMCSLVCTDFKYSQKGLQIQEKVVGNHIMFVPLQQSGHIMLTTQYFSIQDSLPGKAGYLSSLGACLWNPLALQNIPKTEDSGSIPV